MKRVGRVRGVVIGLSLLVVMSTLMYSAAADGVVVGAQWPRFHGDNTLSGYSNASPFTASNASTLGVDWEGNSGAADWSSPMVAWSPALQKAVVYEGNKSGVETAYDVLTGAVIWQFKAGLAVNSTPALSGRTLFFGSSDFNLYAVNADTGAFVCKVYLTGQVLGSPVVGNPDGNGDVVYVGDGGASGQDDGGHEWAINPSNCSVKWSYDAWGDPPGSAAISGGSWTPQSYAVDSTGRPLVIFGGGDGAVYALDARDGSRVWMFQTPQLEGDDDVGSGPTLSLPGVNGFADGVVYIPGKDRILYALDMLTGAPIWSFAVRDDSPKVSGSTKSTPALVGNTVYFGYGAGVYAVNATTGAKIWKSTDVGPATQIVISSVAVAGPGGDRVVFGADVAGGIFALDAQTGARIWSYDTGGVLGSPALADDRLLVPGMNGFLYAFALNGIIGDRPDTTITTPVDKAIITVSGSSSYTISGGATSDVGVDHVNVAVQDKTTRHWWNAATGKWNKFFVENSVPVASPGANSTTWQFNYPLLPKSLHFFAQATAVSSDGLSDATLSTVNYTLTSEVNPPVTTITYPKYKTVIPFPGGVRASFPVTVTGNAVDTAGTHPGIQTVYVRIKNNQHNEYWCGPNTCADPSGWQPQPTTIALTPTPAGGTSVTWSITFETYDHPHQYSVIAYSKDGDGEVDLVQAKVSKFCVVDPGDNCSTYAG